MKNSNYTSNFSSYMKSKIFGQDQIIDAMDDLLNISFSGLNDENKPIASLLFTGPTGVGKTEFAKELAKFLDIHFERLDMSEYAYEYSARNSYIASEIVNGNLSKGGSIGISIENDRFSFEVTPKEIYHNSNNQANSRIIW